MPSRFDIFRNKLVQSESRQAGIPEGQTLAAKWFDDRIFYEAISRGHIDQRLEFVQQQLGGSVRKDRDTIAALLRKELENPVMIKSLAVQTAEGKMDQLLHPAAQEFSAELGLDKEQVYTLFNSYVEEELAQLKKKVQEAIDFILIEIK